VDDAVREIVGGRADDGERRAELVRNRRDELELLPREILGPARREDQESDADAEESEDAGADEQVAAPDEVDRVLERSGRVLYEQAPLGRRDVGAPAMS
jgi:hypothetical protein